MDTRVDPPRELYETGKAWEIRTGKKWPLPGRKPYDNTDMQKVAEDPSHPLHSKIRKPYTKPPC